MNPKSWHHDDPPEKVQTARRKTVWAICVGAFIAFGLLWVILQPIWKRSNVLPSARTQRGIFVSPADPDQSALNKDYATNLLIDAIIQLESQGNPNMVGGIGERGLMQIREGTWNDVTLKHFGAKIDFDRAFDPELNRQVGRFYLGDLQIFLYKNREEWRSDLRSLLLACYNAGPHRVRKSEFNLKKLPKNVQSYASRGSALHDWYLEEDAEILHQELIKARGNTD